MPVNVDTVYQTVQALANKEQRGYLTPQEFNLFAIQAQKDIFEQYLYDLDATRSAKPQEQELADSVQHILFKIHNTTGVSIVISPAAYTPSEGHKIHNSVVTGQIIAKSISGEPRTIKEIKNIDEIHDLLGSRWHSAGFDSWVYFRQGSEFIRVYKRGGEVTGNNSVFYERIVGFPGIVNWGYSIVNENPVYNPSISKNFALHESEQPDLVSKILKLTGISTEDQQLYQAGQAEEALNTQQQNK